MYYNQMISCPNCPKRFNKREEQIGEWLALVESDCVVDICKCRTCKKTFEVSYKVDQVTELEGWS